MIAGNERLAVDVADALALKARATSGDPSALRSAARQFESLLVAQMLKTMRETRFSEEDDPMTGGDGVKLYRELLDQQWAAQLAGGRGLGFADMMVKAMEGRGMNAVADAAADVPLAQSGPLPVDTAQVKADKSIPPVAQDDAMRAAGAQPAAAIAPAVSAPPLIVGEGVANRKQQFLNTMKPHADAAAAATGVPARFILAHAALESGWGQREIRDDQGTASHNLFGIKAGGTWDGAAVHTTTTEYRQGMPMKLVQSFRAYDDYSAGFTDYANLLKSRYGAAARAGTDESVFAQGLAAGGYATDPAYAGKLKAVIASVAMAGG